MRRISRTARQWGLGVALLVSALLVWWAQIYAPRVDRLQSLAAQIVSANGQGARLKHRLERFSGKESRKTSGLDQVLAKLSSRIVSGMSIEEVDAFLQLEFQKFFQNHQIPLISYRELPPVKWRGFDMGRVEFQLQTGNQGISELLHYLEKTKRLVQVQRLAIYYRRAKGNPLNVTLVLGTLFVKDVGNTQKAGKK